MKRRALFTAVLVLSALLCAGNGDVARPPLLRVCSDPNNLPFSNRRGEGFEDKLAKLLGAHLNMRVEHFFWAQRRGFIRNTLKANACDVILGVPNTLDMVLTTEPYYRSSYMFVERQSKQPPVNSLEDPRLHQLRIGVPVVGDDYANPPPVHALARRGIVRNVVGFSVFGDYRQDSPPLALIHAVERKQVDLAIAWGPQAGFVARQARAPLRLQRVLPDHEGPYPFTFAIAMGVRKEDQALKQLLDRALRENRKRIEELLREYGVPLL